MTTTATTTSRKATLRELFNYANGINPAVNTISSLGDYVSDLHQQIADARFAEIMDAISKDSLAHKILMSGQASYTEKQIWVIAYELQKNEVKSIEIAAFYDSLNKKVSQKKEASRSKLQANKAASNDVLKNIKDAGLLLGDYYKWLNTSGNVYRKEHFNKKYSEASANAFIVSRS